MGRGANEIIDLIRNRCHLRVTLSFAYHHHLHRCLFDLAQINRDDSLAFPIANTFNDGIQ